MMRLLMGTIAACAIVAGAHADPCSATFHGNNGVGQGAHVTLNNCASQSDLVAIANDFNSSNQINQTNLVNQNQINQTFNNRFNDLQSQISNNQSEARRGISMALASAGMGAGAAAAAGAGAGKAALSAAVGEFEGQVSLSAGISYAVTKRLMFSAGVSASPFAPVPLVGVFGSATLVLN
jgi:autotransporter adhesin